MSIETTSSENFTLEFKLQTNKDAYKDLENELNKILQSENNECRKETLNKNFDSFKKIFSRYLYEEESSIIWKKIEKLNDKDIIDYTNLNNSNNNNISEMLGKLIVVKLNGGLGTSMGCHGAKSTISVRNELSFLDVTIQQLEHLNKTYNVNVPLVLMNSFNTDEETLKILRKYKGFQLEIYSFNQSCFPRINKESLDLLPKDAVVEKNPGAWYPPGHGDFYEAFNNSGLLEKFINKGFEYCFVSNIDNLAATVDINILNFLLSSQSPSPEFVMEITNKTKSDIKGGTPIRYENKLRLLEIAQVPNEHIDEFKSIKKFQYFNTNNLWIKLKAIQRVLEKGLKLEIIVNPKTIDKDINIIQLETAVGSAMKHFNGALGINVPRSRFLPVKKTQDLLLLMSNLYNLKNGLLTMNPNRMFHTTPFIKLGNHFTKVKDFKARFANIPDLLELDHLTVSGDVTFGKDVKLKGTVIIIANHGEKIDIPAGAILENKIISGHLRILEH